MASSSSGINSTIHKGRDCTPITPPSGKIEPTVQATANIALLSLICPDPSAFDSPQIHRQLAARMKPIHSRDDQDMDSPRASSPPKKSRILKCPEAPRKISAEMQKRCNASPFIQNEIKIREMISQKLEQKEAGEFTPWELEIAPGRQVIIDDISFLSSQGEHSDVYKCEVRDQGSFVLKLSKTDMDLTIYHIANQLRLYAQNLKSIPRHVERFINFDPHVDKIQGMGFSDLKLYVEKEMQQGFSFVRYLPETFPMEFNANSRYWQQLRAIFKDDTNNDLRWDNVRIDRDGVVKIIDIYEFGDINDDFSADKLEMARTYSNNTKVVNWLLSKAESGKDSPQNVVSNVSSFDSP